MNLAQLATPEAGQRCLDLLSSMQQNLPDRGIWAGQSLADALLFVSGKTNSWRPADIDIFEMGRGSLPPGYTGGSKSDSQLADESDVLRYGRSGMVEFIVTRFLNSVDLLGAFDFSFCQIGLDLNSESFVQGPLLDTQANFGSAEVTGVVGQFQRPARLACRLVEKHEAGWLSDSEAAAIIWWLTYLITKVPTHQVNRALGNIERPTKRTTSDHVAKFAALAMSVGSQLRMKIDSAGVFLFLDGVSVEEALEGLELHHGAKQLLSELPGGLNEFYRKVIGQAIERFKPATIVRGGA